MTQAKNVKELKQAVAASKKIFVWVPFAKMVQGGAVVGGYIETYRPQVLNVLKTFALPTTSWDSTVQCFFRLDDETKHLFIEGFLAA